MGEDSKVGRSRALLRILILKVGFRRGLCGIRARVLE